MGASGTGTGGTGTGQPAVPGRLRSTHYKWVALSNTTLGILSATVNGSIVIISLPAIFTDAFPPDQRGTAMGINQVAGISGSFIGLILGGVLAAVDWRLVFLVSVPIGIGGTIWSYLSLRETGVRTKAKIDWLGNVTFAFGLVGILAGITYGIQPYGGHTMGW